MKTGKLTIALTALAVTTAATNAATIASYVAGVAPTAGTTGAADPTTQGWVASTASPGIFNYGADSINGGWRITDGTSGGAFFYSQSLSAAAASDMSTLDWSATWTTAVNADAVDSGGGGVDSFYDAPDNGRQNNNAMWIEVNGAFRYILTFNVDANDDIVLTDGTSNFQITTANNQLSEELGAGSPVANYITFTLNSVGGVVSLSDSLGGSHGAIASNGAAGTDRIVWGATSGSGFGSTTWNALSVDTIPEPGSAALVGIAGLAFALRRRR